MPADPLPQLYTLSDPLSRDQLLDQLATMPAALRDAFHGQPRAKLLTRSGPGEWSAFQTLCHFRDAALVYTLRFRFMVFDDDPLLPNYDENNWVESARDRPEDLPAILHEVAASRAGLVRVLSGLDDGAWHRTGRHEVIGTVMFDAYVRHQLAHERMHLTQIQSALATASADHGG